MYSIFSFIILTISLSHTQSSSNPRCAQYYPYDAQRQQCECDDIPTKGVSLKCIGHAYVPHFFPDIHYHMIELESCSRDLYIGDKTFADLNIHTLRLRHCNLIGLNEQSFSNINYLEKFIIENSTIKGLLTVSGNFQDIFHANSFQKLKLLILKRIHYHQPHKHDKKLNLELLLKQLPKLNRLELIYIYMDNYRYHNLTSIGENLTYLKLINTNQRSLLPIEYLSSLERLIFLYLPKIFHTQPLISSIKQLKRLKYIDFAHNKLTNINDLQSNTIDQIDLRSNLIESIEEYTFEHLPKLRILTLTDNPLQYIDKNAFCGIEKFERLYINIRKSNQISPLDNCILLSHPNLDIIQDSQTKLQCNCRLLNVFQMKLGRTTQINRLFEPNHACIVTNDTLLQLNYYSQLTNYINLPIGIYELKEHLNCSSNDPCDHLCQQRKIQTTLSPIEKNKIDVKIKTKTTSLSMSLYSFSSYALLLLLLAFLYV